MAGKAIDLGAAGERLARNLGAIRAARRLTYTEISTLLSAAGREISPLAVRRIENGERRADAQDIVTLSAVLGIPVETLLLGEVEISVEWKVVRS